MTRRHRELEGAVGQSRPSGRPGDPRARRADEGRTEGQTYKAPLRVDEQGQVSLQAAVDPGPPPVDGLPDDAAAWLAKLYTNLKAQGLIGRR